MRALTPCGQHGFRFYFTGITSLLFTFPSRYWCTIGEIKYLALAGSPACFLPGYLRLTVLKKNIKERKNLFKYGTITLYGIPFQGISFKTLPKCSPSGTKLSKYRKLSPRQYFLTTPIIKIGLGSSLFARHY